jgi:hypothetical protein
MKKSIIFFSLTSFFFCPIFCWGQQDSSGKSELGIGVNFQTKLHYFGRTDRLQSSALVPNIGYQLKNGLYIQSNFIFIQNKAISTTYAGATVEGGYRFKPSKHFNGNIFYTQVLYKDKSQLPQSALKGQTGVNIAYTGTVININAGGDLKFTKGPTDVGATLGADHIFIIHRQNSHWAFAVNPSFYLYAGTHQFTKSYIEQKNFLGIPVSESERTQSYNRFDILSYEASTPLVAVFKKLYATVVPAYVIPQNLLEGESGAKLFYLTFGVGLKL